jgi:hypothetical protein
MVGQGNEEQRRGMIADFKIEPRSLGVRGSIPLSSNKNSKRLIFRLAFFISAEGERAKRAGGLEEKLHHVPGVTVTRDARGGWPPVEAKRRRFPPQLHQERSDVKVDQASGSSERHRPRSDRFFGPRTYPFSGYNQNQPILNSVL